MPSYPKSFTEGHEAIITQGLREEAAAAAKKAGSNKTAKVKGFKFSKYTPGFKMPGDK